MLNSPALEEIEALRSALAEASQLNEALSGELRVVRTERDLFKEQLNQFKRQLFAAKSEALGTHQKDMFFNEAEGQGTAAEPAGEERDEDKIEVPSHKRARRGRKPLDAALPREVIRHELPEGERTCPHDGATLAWRRANSSTSCRSRCA
jgi:transposase